MTELRNFTSTTLLNSYGYIFWSLQDNDKPIIGFMRRPQPEIHHGDPFPWVMATVGGMRDTSKVLDADDGPNAEGFMGRPPSGDEVALSHVALKLGAEMITSGNQDMEGWLSITHPFYYGEKTPDVRNVGTVFRKLRFLMPIQITRLRSILERRNATCRPEHTHELRFLNDSQFDNTVLFNNRGHSLKSGEIDLIQSLYARLPYASRVEAGFQPLSQYL